jgi:hypothetical protein
MSQATGHHPFGPLRLSLVKNPQKSENTLKVNAFFLNLPRVPPFHNHHHHHHHEILDEEHSFTFV